MSRVAGRSLDQGEKSDAITQYPPMSYATAWDRSNRILSKKYYGDISPAEWQTSNAELFAIEEGRAFASARYLIVDYSDASLKTARSIDVRSVVETADKVQHLNPELTLVWVAPSALEFGLVRVLQGMAHDLCWTTHITFSVEKAQGIIAGAPEKSKP